MTKEEIEKLGLLRACETLHMACTNTMDGLSEEDLTRLAEYIRSRLLKWDDGRHAYMRPAVDRYDRAVYELAQCALTEYITLAGDLTL